MALTDTNQIYEPLRQEGKVAMYLVNGGATAGLITQGCLAVLDADGYLRTTALASAATNVFAGVTLDGVDNQTGVDGAASVTVAKSGIYEYYYTADGDNFTTPTQNLVGKVAYLVTNNCVTTDGDVPANAIPCGVVVGINAGAKTVRIRIDGYTK